MTKQAILALIVALVVAAAWVTVREDKADEKRTEVGITAAPGVDNRDASSNGLHGADAPDPGYESRSAPEQMPVSVGPGSSSGVLAEPGSAVPIPPEGLPGEAQLPMGPAPEASDTGIMGPAPESGDTGIVGPAPEADALVIENEAPEFGQPTETGSSPESSNSP